MFLLLSIQGSLSLASPSRSPLQVSIVAAASSRMAAQATPMPQPMRMQPCRDMDKLEAREQAQALAAVHHTLAMHTARRQRS